MKEVTSVRKHVLLWPIETHWLMMRGLMRQIRTHEITGHAVIL